MNVKVITYALTGFWSLLHITLTTNISETIHSVAQLDSEVLSYMIIISLLSAFTGIFTGIIIKSIDTIARLLAGIIVSVIVTIGIFIVFSKSPESWFFFTTGSLIIGSSVYYYGLDLMSHINQNYLIEGRRVSIRKLIIIMLLTLPISLMVLFRM